MFLWFGETKISVDSVVSDAGSCQIHSVSACYIISIEV